MVSCRCGCVQMPQLLGVTASSNEECLVEERVDEALQGPWSPTRPVSRRQKHFSQNAKKNIKKHVSISQSYTMCITMRIMRIILLSSFIHEGACSAMSDSTTLQLKVLTQNFC